ncbi:Sec-independent protein translocase protein TatB [Acinetobacter indicus]|uniref:Sec-independent protein translocase protein TatB n=1 Tax=Acinetobacter indicus TaxID=756892 RepID=UPI0014445BBF|nr:Sec-independent protein translocase protein TatB [Acinetobacter indicus]
MLNIGMTELLFFGIIALLVLGPEKLPEAARFVGKWYGKIKRTISNVQNDIDRELRLSELREQMQQEMARIQELEQKMQSQMYELKQQKIFAEEQPNQTAATDNKNLPTRYTFIAPQPSLLLHPQHQPLTAAEAIPPTTSQFTDYKVAV